MFPIIAWEQIANRQADAALIKWGHYLEGCNRPFGKQSFGLVHGGHLVSVAVSASTVGVSAAGFPRRDGDAGLLRVE